MLRIIISGSMLSLALAGAIFVAKNSAPDVPTTRWQSTESQNKNISSSGPFVENLTNNLKAKIQAANLTDTFIKEIEKNVTQKTEFAYLSSGDIETSLPDPDLIAQNVLFEAVQKFNPDDLRPKIENHDLKISKDKSLEAAGNYFWALSEIMDKYNVATSPIFRKTQNPSLGDVNKLSSAYEKTIGELYKLSVPESAVPTHKELLGLLGTQLAIFEYINNYQNDPMQAILASDYLEQSLSEFLDFSNKFPIYTENYFKNNFDI